MVLLLKDDVFLVSARKLLSDDLFDSHLVKPVPFGLSLLFMPVNGLS